MLPFRYSTKFFPLRKNGNIFAYFASFYRKDKPVTLTPGYPSCDLELMALTSCIEYFLKCDVKYNLVFPICQDHIDVYFLDNLIALQDKYRDFDLSRLFLTIRHDATFDKDIYKNIVSRKINLVARVTETIKFSLDSISKDWRYLHIDYYSFSNSTDIEIQKIVFQNFVQLTHRLNKKVFVTGVDTQGISDFCDHVGLDYKSGKHLNNIIDLKIINGTDRELEVIHCVTKGMSNSEIADALFIATSTVQNHIKNIIRKNGLLNRNGIIQTCSVYK